MSKIRFAENDDRSNLLQVDLLGSFSLLFDGRKIVLKSRKAQAILGLLALSKNGEESRDYLVGMLWSESDQNKARASLRQVTRILRNTFQECGFDGYRDERRSLSLDRASIRVDVDRVVDEVRNGDPMTLLSREKLADDLLKGLDGVDPAFSIWILARRQTLSNQLTVILEDLIRGDALSRNSTEQVAHALLGLDPTHEEAVRELMVSKASAGDIGGALSVYGSLWQTLDEQYDVEPSLDTQMLVARLKLSGTVEDQRQAPVAAQPLPATGHAQQATPQAPVQPTVHDPDAEKLVISIEPFDLSGVRDQNRYIVHGFRRELIACLVRFREWILHEEPKYESSPADAVTNRSTFAIGGGASEGPDSLRFVLTLLDKQTDGYLWSEAVELSTNSWFEMQQFFVRRIATALRVHVSAERVNRIASREVTDLVAFDKWLLGQATFLSFDRRQWRDAAEQFLLVINSMPHFAPAYSSLAQLYNSEHIVMPGVLRDSKRTERALELAREAARLDPVDSRSQLCLGWSHAMSKNYDQAMIYIPLAYELNANDPWTMVSAANCFAFCGEYERAKKAAREALNLPLTPNSLQWSYHVAVRFMCGDYEGLLDAAAHVADVNPNVPGYKAVALYHLGDEAGASRELAHFYGLARRRWASDKQPSGAAIARWFLTMFPIANADDWERLRAGLAGAGAPTDGLAHNQW